MSLKNKVNRHFEQGLMKPDRRGKNSADFIRNLVSLREETSEAAAEEIIEKILENENPETVGFKDQKELEHVKLDLNKDLIRDEVKKLTAVFNDKSKLYSINEITGGLLLYLTSSKKARNMKGETYSSSQRNPGIEPYKKGVEKSLGEV